MSKVWEGPFQNKDRQGDSMLLLLVGQTADGSRRLESHHCNNCKQDSLEEGEKAASRGYRGNNPKILKSSAGCLMGRTTPPTMPSLLQLPAAGGPVSHPPDIEKRGEKKREKNIMQKGL